MRYEIQGDTLPVVICYLDGGEKMITEKGAMSWMSPNMHIWQLLPTAASERLSDGCFPVNPCFRISTPPRAVPA